GGRGHDRGASSGSPRRRRAERGKAYRTSGTSGRRLQPENRAGDDDPLDLARALIDLGDLRVAVVALDLELPRVPVTDEDLDRLGRLAARHLGGEELRLRARLRHRLSTVLQP